MTDALSECCNRDKPHLIKCSAVVAAMALSVLLAAAPAAQAVVKNVAVVETEVDEASGASAEITSAEVRLMTAELRREAVKNLPRAKYNIMTTETVYAQGSAVLEECADENCVIALGSKIGADYIVRGTISKLRTRFTLSVEIYETEDGNLVASSDPVRSDNINDLIEKAAAACADMYKTFADSQNSAPAPSAQRAMPAPEPPAYTAYNIIASANPPSGGGVSRNPNYKSYPSGARVTLSATPNAGYVFTGWSGDASGAANTVTVTADGNKYVTANFRQVATYTVSAKANPFYGGYVSRSPEQKNYASGTVVALTAVPAGGYVFKGWSGAAADTAATIKITMNGDKELTADFQALCTLSRRVHPSGGGHINSSPSGDVYPFGTLVSVTAVPADGYLFKGWSGVKADSANPAAAAIAMTGDKTLTAKFYRPKTEEEIRAAKRTRLFVGASLDILGAGVLAYGLFKESQVSEQVGSGEYPSAEKSAKSRNAAYTVGSMILLSGISVHIFF